MSSVRSGVIQILKEDTFCLVFKLGNKEAVQTMKSPEEGP